MAVSAKRDFASRILRVYCKNTMCGIAGYWDKGADESTLLGSRLLKMLMALGCRGPDSTGVAMYGTRRAGSWIARDKLGDNGGPAERASQVAQAAANFGAEDFTRVDAYLRF